MSIWTRRRHARDPRDFCGEVGSRVSGKIGLLYWAFVFGWACLRSVAYGFSLLVSTTVGRVLGGLLVVALLLDAAWGADTVALPVSWALVTLLAGLVGYVMWTQRKRWESHLENVVYHSVPGHSRSEPEHVRYPPNLGRFVQGGRWLRTPNFGFRIPGAMKENEAVEVTTQLRSRLPAARDASWMILWDWRLGRARATLVPNMPDFLGREELAGRMLMEEAVPEPDLIPVGVSVDGVEFYDVENVPHFLATGETGRGKTVALMTVVAHCMEFSDWWGVVACDPKRVELGFLEGRPGVKTVVKRHAAIVEAIQEAEAEMDARLDRMEAAGPGMNHIRKVDPSAKRLLLVVDELQQVTMPTGDKEADAPRNAARASLERISALGRSAGIHLYLCTQRPDVEKKILTGPLKHNLGGRLAVGRMDTTASMMGLDTDAATMLPERPKGRAIFRGLEGDKQIQVVFTREEDLPEREVST